MLAHGCPQGRLTASLAKDPLLSRTQGAFLLSAGLPPSRNGRGLELCPHDHLRHRAIGLTTDQVVIGRGHVAQRLCYPSPHLLDEEMKRQAQSLVSWR
jgi:hypothetical protein